MGTTKLISMRMEEELLQKIESFLKGKSYWSRTTVINRLITALFQKNNMHVVDAIMLHYDSDTDEVQFSATIKNCNGIIRKNV